MISRFFFSNYLVSLYTLSFTSTVRYTAEVDYLFKLSIKVSPTAINDKLTTISPLQN